MRNLSSTGKFLLKKAEWTVHFLFVFSSTIGVVFTTFILHSVARFTEREFYLTALFFFLVLLAGFLFQIFFVRRNLRNYLLFSKGIQNGGGEIPLPSSLVYEELLLLPYRFSRFLFFLWLVEGGGILFGRVLFLYPHPWFRTYLLFLGVWSGTFLVLPLSYFLFRAYTQIVLRTLPPPPSLEIPTLPFVPKYAGLSGSLVLSFLLYFLLFVYGFLHNALEEEFFRYVRWQVKNVQTLLSAREDLSSLLGSVPALKMARVLPQPSPSAIPFSNFLEEKGRFFFFPLYRYETQEMGEDFLFYLSLSGGKVLEIHFSPWEFFQGTKEIMFFYFPALSLFLLFVFSFILIVSFADISRPLRSFLRDVDPRYPFKSPSFSPSDDEVVQLIIILQTIFGRFQKLIKGILDIYWVMRDTGKGIRLPVFSSEISPSDLVEFHSKLLSSEVLPFYGFPQEIQIPFEESWVDEATYFYHRVVLELETLSQFPLPGFHDSSSLEVFLRGKEFLKKEIEKGVEYYIQLRAFWEEQKRVYLQFSQGWERFLSHLELTENLFQSQQKTFHPIIREETILLHIKEIEKIQEWVDAYGFEAILLAEEAPLSEGEFRVVGEEVRDLVERGRNLTKELKDTFRTFLFMRRKEKDLWGGWDLFSSYIKVQKGKVHAFLASLQGVMEKGEKELEQINAILRKMREASDSLEERFSFMEAFGGEKGNGSILEPFFRKADSLFASSQEIRSFLLEFSKALRKKEVLEKRYKDGQKELGKFLAGRERIVMEKDLRALWERYEKGVQERERSMERIFEVWERFMRKLVRREEQMKEITTRIRW